MCSRACHCYAAGRILPSCPCPDGHLVRKKHFGVLKCAVTTATSACCKRPQRVARRHQKKASRSTPDSVWREIRDTNLVGSSWSLGKHLCWVKGTRAGNLQQKKNHTYTHTHPFQTQGIAGLRSRHQHSSPDPSRGQGH